MFTKGWKDWRRIHAAARRAKAYRTRPSGAEVMSALLSQYAIAPHPGESRVETLVRAAGISTRELKDLLWEHAQTAGPELERATEAFYPEG